MRHQKLGRLMNNKQLAEILEVDRHFVSKWQHSELDDEDLVWSHASGTGAELKLSPKAQQIILPNIVFQFQNFSARE